jgi:hypothetical protein
VAPCLAKRAKILHVKNMAIHGQMTCNNIKWLSLTFWYENIWNSSEWHCFRTRMEWYEEMQGNTQLKYQCGVHVIQMTHSSSVCEIHKTRAHHMSIRFVRLCMGKACHSFKGF